MRRSLALIAVAVTLAYAVCLATAGEPIVLSRVTVRTYNGFGISSKTLERAERISAGILGDAGVGATWRNCRMPSGPAAAWRDDCSELLADDEVIVRIVRAPKAFGGPNASFGYSLVSSDARRGSLATVFAVSGQMFQQPFKLRLGARLQFLVMPEEPEFGSVVVGSLVAGCWSLVRSSSS